MTVGIQSEFDCVLKIGQQEFFLKQNLERVELSQIDSTQCLVHVYPTCDGQLLPYAFVLVFNKDGQISCSNPHAKVFKVGEEQFEVFLQPNKLKTFFGGKTHAYSHQDAEVVVIEGKPNLVCIKDSVGTCFFEFEGRVDCLAFEVKNKVSFFVATLKNNRNKFICVFCPESRQFFSYFAANIKIINNTIEITTKIVGQAKHGKFVVLSLQEQGRVEKQIDELLYLEDAPVRASNLKVIPFAFFESVKQGDFNLAKSYLSPALAKQIDGQVLKQYFGDFEKVAPYNFHQKHGLYVCVYSKQEVGVFSFNFNEGKISEIDLVKKYNKKH